MKSRLLVVTVWGSLLDENDNRLPPEWIRLCQDTFRAGVIVQ